MIKNARSQSQMWPIDGASKAVRLKWGSPQNHMSWAYMKQLREKNRTLRTYEVNPYIEVYRFRNNLYGLFHPNCDGAGDVWMYLIIGPEKAMLIDTGFGLGDLKGLVDEITGGMPLIVVNTHTGPDHVLGNFHFDTVYCLDLERDNILKKCSKDAFDYLFDENGGNIWLQFDRNDLPTYREYELIGVPDGHLFNLGEDYDVEIIWTAGHAAGHAMFLDRKGRNLFAGDDVCSDVIGCGSGPKAGYYNNQYCNLVSYRNCLVNLVNRMSEFDYIFPGHFIVNLENYLLKEILETLNEIIEDPLNYDYKVEHGGGNNGTKRVRMHKFVKGFGTIAYTENGIYPPDNQ